MLQPQQLQQARLSCLLRRRRARTPRRLRLSWRREGASFPSCEPQ
jgi:hypothetical protein